MRGDNGGGSLAYRADEDMSDITPPGGINGFNFPKSVASQVEVTRPGHSTTSTPSRRRSAAPGVIPNFSSSSAPREPAPFFDSPTTSPPPQRSPISSPPTRTLPTMRLPDQPFTMPAAASTSASPWLALAAASGAPTPSLESGPGGPGRSSPHLGYPFERLNIGGSWSGANLWGEGSSGRRGSDSSLPDEGLTSSPTPSKDTMTSTTPQFSLNPDALAGFRNITAQASNMGRGKLKDEGLGITTPLTTGLSSSPNSRVSLPAALARRRGSIPKNVLDGVLSPPLVIGSKAPSPLASSTSSPSPAPQGLQPIPPAQLASLINRISTLILDLRPPSAFQSSHIPSSHSLPIPSTLLRRPAFTLQKLTQMLSPPSSDAVAQWREKADIVLVDADTISPTSTGILEGLAGKFEREGFHGRVWYLKGGLNAINSATLRLISSEEEDAQGPSIMSGGLGKLDRLAFHQASTGSNLQHSPTATMPQTPGLAVRSDIFSNASPAQTERPSFFHRLSVNDRTNGSSSQSASMSRSSSHKGGPQLQPANPFFDNIRQNLELSHGGGHERIALELPQHVTDRVQELPPWLSELVNMEEAQSAQRLAEEFYTVELGEQKRLQAVMDWHSSSSGNAVSYSPDNQRELDAKERSKLEDWSGGFSEGDAYFPFSITAGVERGSKNRYKNIWPYDFSRVRLDSPPEGEGDYINASFVQPRGTARRYIATQGPLDATYCDFWTLVWEQGVKVIVMITKQYEGGLMKCGNYWDRQQYGPIHVDLASQTGGEDHKPADVSGFDFGMAAKSEAGSPSSNIQRVFTLSRSDKPDAPPRKVIQIQCTCWPDFDVPESPDVLLNLIKDVDAASGEACMAVGEDRANHPPVLVHCSAGVGRTGTFIVVDSVLDALRLERHHLADPYRHPGASSPGSTSLHQTHLPESTEGLASPPSLGSRGDSDKSIGTLSLLSAQGSIHNGGGGSGDSGKSVSFLIPTSTSTLNPGSNDTPFSKSPSPLEFPSQPSHGSPSKAFRANHPQFEGFEIGTSDVRTKAGSRETSRGEKMEVDSMNTTGLKNREHPKLNFSDMFHRHRGGSVASIDSETIGTTRRPSLGTSQHDSSESVIVDKPPNSARAADLGHPMPVTKSHERHRATSPLTDSDGLSPVALVLEAMRLQRMSLVQTLRQYIFVHKAILQGYLNMVDEDHSEGRERTTSTDSVLSRSSRMSASRHRRSSSTDDDAAPKRRASLTELMPEIKEGSASGTTSLAKRASFKKMRPAKVGGIMDVDDDTEGSPRRKRKNSKLGREDRG